MLSKKTQYAIYALIKLSKENGKGPILISDIAKSENLPKKFLEAILLELRNFGIVSSKKGKGGGYYLIKNPADISLVDVIRIFDGSMDLLPCVSSTNYSKCEHCASEELCGLNSVLREIKIGLEEKLRGISIKEIINRELDLSTINFQYQI